MVVGEFTASNIAAEQDKLEDDKSNANKASKVDYTKLEADVAALKSLAGKVSPALTPLVALGLVEL